MWNKNVIMNKDTKGWILGAILIPIILIFIYNSSFAKENDRNRHDLIIVHE